MAINIATAVVKIQANADQAQQGIGGIIRMLAGGGGIALGAAAASAAVIGIGVASVKMAGDFQAGLTSLVTGAGESASNLKLVGNGILNLATQTGTSTQQLIAGMYMIESGGYHGAAGLAILKAAAEGAKVGNADLGTVADATDTILKNFGSTGLSASGAVNTLIATVSRGKTHMQDLSDSLSQVLPTASAAKIGLNDVMGAMATLTGEGVPAANAATYLRQTILALMAPSKTSQKALAGIGLSSTQVAGEMQKSLPDALKMIQQHLAQTYAVGSPQYVAALKNIAGGSKQMQGLLDLTGTHLKTFQGNVEGVSGAVKKGGDKINGWTAVQGTFNQKMDKLNQVVQTTLIRLGEKLLPVVTKLAGWLADHLPGAISKVTGLFHKLSDGVRNVVKFFNDAGPAATAVKLALGALAGILAMMAGEALVGFIAGVLESIPALIAQAGAGWAAAAAMIAAEAPMLLIGAAIGLVIGLIILAVTHWKQITTALGHFKEILGALLSKLGEFIGGVLSKLGELASKVLSKLGALKDEAIQKVKDLIGGALNLFIEIEIKIPLKVAGMVLGVLGHLKDMAVQGLGHVKDMVGNILGAVGGFVISLLAKFGQMQLKAVEFFLGLGGKALGAIKTMAGNIIGKALDLDHQMVTWGLNLVTHIMGALASLPGKMLALGGQLIKSIAKGIAGAAGDVTSALKNVPLIGGMAGKLSNILPHFAAGGVMPNTGYAVVGENGPELVRLPAGSQVYPNVASNASALATLPGGTPLYGAASGTTNGQPMQVNLIVDGKRLATIVTQYQPGIVRNATGARGF